MENRDSKGRFLKGAPGISPGRPSRAVEDSYLDATIGSVSLDEWREVVCKALEQAKDGDAKARDWLSKYLIPEQAVKLLFAADDLGQEGPRRFKLIVPPPQVGPHGEQDVIEGETGGDV